MKKIAPISLIWLSVLFAVLALLSNLGIVSDSFGQIWMMMSVASFIVGAILCWIHFLKASRNIKNLIDAWDDGMKKDIPVFLQTRKMRLITLFAFTVLLFGTQYFVSNEMFMYVLIIGLFHCSLVTTLVMFKMYRAQGWIEHENFIASREQE